MWLTRARRPNAEDRSGWFNAEEQRSGVVILFETRRSREAEWLFCLKRGGAEERSGYFV